VSPALLIVNADDYGLTPGVCEAVLTAHDRGVVSSTSALVVAPAWQQYGRRLADTGLGVGIHLCVVGEDPPLLSASEIPSLVDERGHFPMSWKQFLVRAGAGRIDTADLRRELSAQAESAAASGARLTHVDSHQNLHQWPQLSTVLFDVAATHGLHAARCTRSNGWGPASLGVRALGRVFEERCRRRGVVVPAASTGLDEAGSLDRPAMLAAIDALAATGASSAELATHPGLADDPDRARYQWGYRWADEFEALCDPAVRRSIEESGFVLADFGTLAGVGTDRDAST